MSILYVLICQPVFFLKKNYRRATTSSSRDGKDLPTLSVDCQLEISALVPREGKWLPKRLVSKSGSIVIQQMLNIMVPRFLKQLAKDYEVWSNGDDSRAPIQSVSMSNEGQEGALRFEEEHG
jgi:hypothetical protein